MIPFFSTYMAKYKVPVVMVEEDPSLHIFKALRGTWVEPPTFHKFPNIESFCPEWDLNLFGVGHMISDERSLTKTELREFPYHFNNIAYCLTNFHIYTT